jgi:hypothetical protein
MRRVAMMFVLLAGCQARPRPTPMLATPPVATLVTHYAGSAISGPTTAPANPTANPLIIRVRWVALANMPNAPSTPVGSLAHLIVAGNTDAPLLGSPGLTAGARLVEGSVAESMDKTLSGPPSPTQAPIADRIAALPGGVTSVFNADVGGSTSVHSTVELRISRGTAIAPASQPGGERFACSLTIARHDAFAPSNAPALESEAVLFSINSRSDNNATVLLIPMTFAEPKAKVLAASIEIRMAQNNAADDALIAQCDADLQQSTQLLAGRSGMLPTGISQSAGVNSALRAMRLPDQQRSSLVYLADQTGAHLAQDVALVADSSVLLQLSEKVLAGTGNVPADALPTLGWVLDRGSFELLVSLADSPEGNKLPPELATVLTQFCGEAARHSASLDEIAHGMSSQIDLHNRIIAQNLIFLTDSSPASRVRAFDWLNSRHLAPAGYDPLGPARERRVALDRASTQPS